MPTKTSAREGEHRRVQACRISVRHLRTIPRDSARRSRRPRSSGARGSAGSAARGAQSSSRYVSPSGSKARLQRSARTESSRRPSSVTVTTWACALGRGLGVDRRPHDRALVEAKELGRRHRRRALPVLVDVLLERGEAVRRDDPRGVRVRRPAPDELDLDVVAARGEARCARSKAAYPRSARRLCTCALLSECADLLRVERHLALEPLVQSAPTTPTLSTKSAALIVNCVNSSLTRRAESFSASPRMRMKPPRSPPCGSRKTGSKLSISPSSCSRP